jgi:hypothetical protein
MGRILQATPSAMAQQAAVFRQIANLPPDVRAQIQESYQDGQIVVLPLPYWSTVRFQASRAPGPPVAFTIDTTERKAFAYSIGQPLQIAGFLSGNATIAETNLLKASETRDNADVWIWGIAAYLTQDSEPALARRIWRETSVAISLNGTMQIPLGTLEDFPAGGGLYGTGVSYIKSPDLATPGAVDNGAGAPMPFMNNGNPMSGSFFRLNQPFKWASVGTAGADSSLVITCTPQRTITETSAVARAAAAGVSAFTPPAAAGDPGTFVDVRFRLICVSVAKRSVNT